MALNDASSTPSTCVRVQTSTCARALTSSDVRSLSGVHLQSGFQILSATASVRAWRSSKDDEMVSMTYAYERNGDRRTLTATANVQASKFSADDVKASTSGERFLSECGS